MIKKDLEGKILIMPWKDQIPNLTGKHKHMRHK